MTDIIPAVVIEAFPSPPVGDTTIKDRYERVPGKSLVGRTCAATRTFEPELIAGRICSDIDNAGGVRNLSCPRGGLFLFGLSGNNRLLRELAPLSP